MPEYSAAEIEGFTAAAYGGNFDDPAVAPLRFTDDETAFLELWHGPTCAFKDMTVGEEKELNVTFPENYVENLAGKDVVFKVKLNSLTVAEYPELDDEFAKDVSEFDTIDEYKADMTDVMFSVPSDKSIEKVVITADAVKNGTPPLVVRKKKDEESVS